MWDFPTLSFTCRRNRFHGRAYHVGYTRTTRAVWAAQEWQDWNLLWYHVRSNVPTKKLKLIGRRPKQVYEDISNSGLRRCGTWDFPTEKTNKTYTSTRTLYHTPKNYYILALKAKRRSAPCFVNAAVIPLVDLWYDETAPDIKRISIWSHFEENESSMDLS